MSSTTTWMTAGIGIFAVLVIALETTAIRSGFEGPLHDLLHDFVGAPQSATTPWAGLGLAMVGLTTRWRIGAVALAAGIDVIFAAERMLRGGEFSMGNGPLIVLTGLALLVGLRWSGMERANALHGVALGFLVILAAKAGYTWLRITTVTRPVVLDEYLVLADQALGQPAWLAGRVIDAAGSTPTAVLLWVYIELTAAALVVALYQLRNVTTSGWPRHHLVRTFLVLGLVGPVLYLVFPVVGPVFAYWTDGGGFQIGDYWSHILPPLDYSPEPLAFDNITARNCMPSMHTAWALAIFIHSRNGPRWLRWGGTFWLVGTVVATLGFGYHYGVDLVVGAVLCLTLESALRAPERGWDWSRVRLVVGGALLLAVMLLCFRYLPVQMARWPLIAGSLVIGTLGLYVAAFFATFFARREIPLSESALRNASGAAPQADTRQPEYG